MAAVDRSMKLVFNKKGTFKYAEAFSKCCDKLLKSINAKAVGSIDEIELKISKIVTFSLI